MTVEDLITKKTFVFKGDTRRGDRYHFVHGAGLLVNKQYACMITNITKYGFTMHRHPFDPKDVLFVDLELREVKA